MMASTSSPYGTSYGTALSPPSSSRRKRTPKTLFGTPHSGYDDASQTSLFPQRQRRRRRPPSIKTKLVLLSPLLLVVCWSGGVLWRTTRTSSSNSDTPSNTVASATLTTSPLKSATSVVKQGVSNSRRAKQPTTTRRRRRSPASLQKSHSSQSETDTHLLPILVPLGQQQEQEEVAQQQQQEQVQQQVQQVQKQVQQQQVKQQIQQTLQQQQEQVKQQQTEPLEQALPQQQQVQKTEPLLEHAVVVQPASTSTQTRADEQIPVVNPLGSVKKISYYYYVPSQEDNVLPTTVYNDKGQPIALASLQAPHTEIYLQRQESPLQVQRQTSPTLQLSPAAPQAARTIKQATAVQAQQQQAQQEKEAMPRQTLEMPEKWGASTTQDQYIIISTVAVMALLVGALTARKLRSRSLLGICIENESLRDEVAYDAAYTTTNGSYDSFSSRPWKGDLEKFDV